MSQSVGIYIRVSTQEQAQEGYSIEAQTTRLKSFCHAKNWNIHKIYTDGGFSGSNINRPAMQQLIEDINKKSINCVLVYKLDRLSRSQKDTLFLIEDLFLKNNVEFVSVNENFDTSTPFGRATIGMLSVFAQLEREQIKERSIMGRTERAKNGLWHGGGFRPFGYNYIDGKLIVNDFEALQIREIYDLYLCNMSIYKITETMNQKYKQIEHESTIRNILTTSLYKGAIKWNGVEYPGKHPAIIDEPTYEKVAKKYNSTKWQRYKESVPRPFQVKQLLSSLMYCENCGARYFTKGNYSGRGEKKRYYPYYYCYSRAKTSKKFIIDPTCQNPVYAVEKLDLLIIEEIRKLSVDNKYLMKVKNKDRKADNKHIIEKQVENLDNQITRLLDLYQIGVVPAEEIRSRILPLQDKKNLLLEGIAASKKEDALLTLPEVRTILKNADETFKNGSFLEKRNMIMSLIKSITINKEYGKFNIYWNF